LGVYFDYFRAADDEVAIGTRVLTGGPSAAHESFDSFETKAVFPDPHLELLVALAAGVPYQRGPRTSARLWPPPDTPPPVDETSLWLTDPSVERLATRIRDALADIGPDEAPDLGRRWAPDLDHGPDEATQLVLGLAALARRARDAGEELYCWSSL
jgi:hypothetical protein